MELLNLFFSKDSSTNVYSSVIRDENAYLEYCLPISKACMYLVYTEGPLCCSETNPDDAATTEFYDKLLVGYDGRIRPNFNGMSPIPFHSCNPHSVNLVHLLRGAFLH